MYKPVQKKNSSWTPSTAQKKGKSPSKLGHTKRGRVNPYSTRSWERLAGERKLSRRAAQRLGF